MKTILVCLLLSFLPLNGEAGNTAVYYQEEIAGGIGPILRECVSDSQAEGDMTGESQAQISNALILDDTEYFDADFTVTQPDGTCTYYFGTGYIKQDGLQYAVSPGQTPVQSPPQYFYYTKDYLGNIRSVVTKNPSTNAVTEVQRTHYYPYGGIIADIGTGQNIQPRLYNGKELDRTILREFARI